MPVWRALRRFFAPPSLTLSPVPKRWVTPCFHSDAVVVLVGEKQVDLLTAASAAQDIHVRVIVVGQSIVWPDNAQSGPLPDLVASDHAILMYTSGTTGRPKGVLHTHASLLAGGWTTTLAHDLSPLDRGLCVLPIYHINGLCVTIMGPPDRGRIGRGLRQILGQPVLAGLCRATGDMVFSGPDDHFALATWRD